MILWKNSKKMYLWMWKSRLMEKLTAYKWLDDFGYIGTKYTPKPLYAHFKAEIVRQAYKGSPYYTGLLSVHVQRYRQTIIDEDTGKQQNEIIVRLWVYVFTFGWPSNFYRLCQRWR